MVILLNIPLLTFFFRPADLWLQSLPVPVLRVVFYPAAAWMATAIAFFFLSVFTTAVSTSVHAIRWLCDKAWGLIKPAQHADPVPVTVSAALSGNRLPGASFAENESTPAVGSPAKGRSSPASISRRGFLAAGPGLMIPAIYGVAAYGEFSHLDQIDVSPEFPIAIAGLPRAVEGLTIVQLSDLHVGTYIRQRELEHAVSLVNQLRPDIVAITGDILDRSLGALPDAVAGLRGIRASIGTLAVLGNHDYYADFSSSRRYSGGIRIMKALESIGIRTLRNEVEHFGSGDGRFAVMGLDWLTSPGRRDFFSYKPAETRREIRGMMQKTERGAPRILLAHHPDTYMDVPPEISLTLSGHTHGGGQVILGSVEGVPIGIATLRFKYLSGLYQKNGTSLYVNRGLGYLGLPIRINCPPEISRFKLVRKETNT